ncbi:TRAP transporter 4TM/12TM fusion protein [Natrialba chahannaoensis JCM 10990]|uniref:TRAP transporter 4TM/12TM fusion protein n=1 Tax=Natrialba chahannaoensis JCM 10990 TaxID=1227492 RepID=M0AZ76_9EURY|nr:TRAP transporter fused permease subunit [Natrialba chahannaoensis]ELZ02734.1 TRAP transporter 4TM/12TM fusion protein [Natrialba chahannaoensis JCM 10990]
MSKDIHDSDTLSDDEQEELLQEIERQRSHRGLLAGLVALIAIAFSAFQLWIAAYSYQFTLPIPIVGTIDLGSLQQLQVNTIHVTFALILAFLLFPASRGNGFVARRAATVEPAVRNRFGPDSVLTRAVERLGDGVRWAVLDPDLERVVPLDILLIGLTALPVAYTVGEYDEIQGMAFMGIDSARPVYEVYPVLEPVLAPLATIGLPVDVSYAFLMGVLGILLVLEATRRTLGLLLMSLVSLFIIYARWGYLVPSDSAIGALSIPSESWGNIIYNLWYITEAGVMSTPVTVSVRFIFIFILFGAFLEMSGAGKWFIDLAYSLTGTRKGGPAKAGVVSSGFMGMLSGSSIANTVTTGAFTIPLMKRAGYSPSFSGAVESSASSGGQMLPPVMGAAAFLIVEYTGIPYPDVIIGATLPALAFFFGMLVMVHFEAVQGGIGGLARSELPDTLTKLRSGWFYLIPIGLLLYFLVIARFSINRAGWYSIVAVVALLAVITAYNERTRVPLLGTITAIYVAHAVAYAVIGSGLVETLSVILGSGTAGEPYGLTQAATAAAADLGTIAVLVSVAFLLAQPRADAPLVEFDEEVDETAQHSATVLGRPHLASRSAFRYATFVLKSMDSGARTATTVVVAVAAAGVVPGVISVSGLGPNLAQLIDAVSGGSMLILLSLTGIAAVIFGMGMPTTAMYIILIAMLETPLQETGMAILAAHLFILYFGLMADVTPPVAVAAFAGAGVAKADEFKTATTAFLLSLNKILVPFAFVFSPGILLLREGPEEWYVIGLADVTDLGYFVPEVLVPVAGMFLGIYALGVTIIGCQYSPVNQTARSLYAVASILLMVPEIPLLILEGLVAVAGIHMSMTSFAITGSLRVFGLAMLVILTNQNRSRARTVSDNERSTPAAGDA